MEPETTRESYTPKIAGAKALGETIIEIDHTGGYNHGPNDYMAILPGGKKIYSNPDLGQGKKSFLRQIRYEYMKMLKLK